MFKGKLPKPNGVAISIIESEDLRHPLSPQDLLLAGLRDVGLGLPEQLLNHTCLSYYQTPR